MANREHDGSEHAGTRAWDRGQEQDADRDPRTAAGPGEATADAQWFGDAPPPPPYAIDEAPPPPYAVGGLGAYGAERPDPQYPQQPQPSAPQQGTERTGEAEPAQQPPVPGWPQGDPYSPTPGAASPQAPPPPQSPQQPAAPEQYPPAPGHQPAAPPGVPGWPHPQHGGSRPRPPAPDRYPEEPHQQPPQGYPSGPYPAPAPDQRPPEPPQPPESGYPAPGPQQSPPDGGDRPVPPVAYNGQPMRSGPVRPAEAPGAVPPPPPGAHYPAEPPQNQGWGPPAAQPAQDGTGASGPGEFVPEEDAPLWNRAEQAGDPAWYAADEAPDAAGRAAPEPPGTPGEGEYGAAAGPQDPQPCPQPTADPGSSGTGGNGAGRVPTGGFPGGFAQWAPPERAPSPAADAPEDPPGGEPRPGERTEVIEPYSGSSGPPPDPWTREPGDGGPPPGRDLAPEPPGDPAVPPRSSGLGRYPDDSGPQWTSAEPAAPYGAGEGEPPAPLVGDGPAGPPAGHPPEAPQEPGYSGSAYPGHGPGQYGPYGPRSEEVPDPEQLPPLPPNAVRPGGASDPWQGVAPQPGAAPRQDGTPSGPAGAGGAWAWSPPGDGGAPREAWAPTHTGEPGYGADTGGRPAPPQPYGEWAPESAASGPQAWNPMPPPAPEGSPQQQSPHGSPPGAGYPPGYGPARDPYGQSGFDPSGAPPGQPGGYPQAPGSGGSGYPPQPPSGPQTGFQYTAHFADGVKAPQQPGQAAHPETAEDLRAENLVSDKRPGPAKGWRKVLHSATFGLVDVGESAAEQRRRELAERARTQVGGGHHRVAVLSLKGGVGKTTTTVALGSMLASLRGDRVLAVDANPDRGTLSDKVRLETAATIRDLLNEREAISRYADIRGFTSQAGSRLEILASDRDPAVSEAFSEEDYREVSRLLEHYYSICLTDCGTGLLHSAMRGVLGLSDQIVLVSSASVDGARSASATLDWLEAHQYGPLVRGAVVVLSMVRAGKSSVDLSRLEQHFSSRCRAVVRVPWDAHLEEGAEVDLDRLAPGTRDAYLQLAATVGESFAWPR